MAKRIILFLLQFFAFGGLLYVGGNWDVINFALQVRAMQTHTTAWNPIPVIKYPVRRHPHSYRGRPAFLPVFCWS